jgi:Phosphoglyceromutase
MDVGLPEGQMGNSEVGHLNLGAGRIVYQDLTRINKAIADGELERNRVLQDALAAARGHRLHLLGLVSDGGVHSHYSHMIALANAAHAAGVTEIFVHAFTDGRDTSPTGGAGFLRTCEKELRTSGAKIITVVGRYYAMDRDRRWDRTKKAWDAIVLGRGEFLRIITRCRCGATILAWQDRRIHASARFRLSRTNSVSATATRFCFLTFAPTVRASSHKRFC